MAKYLVKIDPFELNGATSTIWFNDLSKAINFISLGISGGIGIDGVAYNPSFLIAKGEVEENAVQKKH